MLTIQTVICRNCGTEFDAERIDGQLQCTDGAGDPVCDTCWETRRCTNADCGAIYVDDCGGH